MEAAGNETAEVWRTRIAAQRASGQSIRGWCRDNGHPEHAFYWWRSRMGLSPKAARRSRGQRVGFAELVVDRSVVAGKPSAAQPAAASLAEPPVAGFAEPIRIHLGGGRELVLPGSMPVERIAHLVRAIQGGSGNGQVAS